VPENNTGAASAQMGGTRLSDSRIDSPQDKQIGKQIE